MPRKPSAKSLAWKCRFNSAACHYSHRCIKCKAASKDRINFNIQLIIMTSYCNSCGAKTGEPCTLQGNEWDGIHQERRSPSYRLKNEHPEEWVRIRQTLKNTVHKLTKL